MERQACSKTSFNKEEVLSVARGDFFGKHNATLPLPGMLMVDRITKLELNGGRFERGYVEAELDIDPKMWFFDCHFPGDPVMPGCLGLDALWQLCGFFLIWSGRSGRGRALGVGEVKFRGQILPDNNCVTYRLDIRRIVERGLIMCIAEGTVSVDGEEIYFAKDLRTGLFQNQGT